MSDPLWINKCYDQKNGVIKRIKILQHKKYSVHLEVHIVFVSYFCFFFNLNKVLYINKYTEVQVLLNFLKGDCYDTRSDCNAFESLLENWKDDNDQSTSRKKERRIKNK